MPDRLRSGGRARTQGKQRRCPTRAQRPSAAARTPAEAPERKLRCGRGRRAAAAVGGGPREERRRPTRLATPIKGGDIALQTNPSWGGVDPLSRRHLNLVPEDEGVRVASRLNLGRRHRAHGRLAGVRLTLMDSIVEHGDEWFFEWATQRPPASAARARVRSAASPPTARAYRGGRVRGMSRTRPVTQPLGPNLPEPDRKVLLRRDHRLLPGGHATSAEMDRDHRHTPRTCLPRRRPCGSPSARRPRTARGRSTAAAAGRRGRRHLPPPRRRPPPPRRGHSAAAQPTPRPGAAPLASAAGGASPPRAPELGRQLGRPRVSSGELERSRSISARTDSTRGVSRPPGGSSHRSSPPPSPPSSPPPPSPPLTSPPPPSPPLPSPPPPSAPPLAAS